MSTPNNELLILLKDPTDDEIASFQSKVEDWMRMAVNDIDLKLGLPRTDFAQNWAATIIACRYQRDLRARALMEKIRETSR